MGRSNPDIQIEASFDYSNIIGEMKVARVDGEGKLVCREFNASGRMIGLYDDDNREIVRLAECLQSAM